MKIDPIWLLLLSFSLALLPVFFSIFTAYLKISIVLGIVKNAIGAQQIPSAMVVMALSLSLTLFVMKPVFIESSNSVSDLKFSELGKNSISEVIKKIEPAYIPWQKFLLRHAGEKELASLAEMQKEISPKNSSVVKTLGFFHLTTAFLLTELKEAFMIGFIIMLPFLVIDLVVANLLTGLGMYMLSPVMISLPIKILVIVGFDAWLLIFKGLFYSYV